MTHDRVTSQDDKLTGWAIAATAAGVLLLLFLPATGHATADQARGGGMPAPTALAPAPAAPATRPAKVPGEVQAVFPAKVADPAGATLTSDPVPGLVSETILRSRPVPRTAAIPFFKITIPDPDDRANTPHVPAGVEGMPQIPPEPAKP